MLDLKEEVVDHVFGQGFVVIGFETQENEEAVPAVHFIESPAWDDVRIRQIEQARGG